MPELMRPVIAQIARFGRDPFALLIVVLAGLGTAHILVRTATDGAAIDGDSVSFLSTARNFLAGEGWRDFAGRPMVGWPPLFPLLLAALDWVGVDPLEGGRWVHAAAFGLIILAAGLYLHSHLRSRGLVLAATALIAASPPLTDYAARLLTEPLFVLFTLLALIWLAAFLHRGERTSLWWAAGFTALAALTRWPGVALVGTGVLLLLVRRTPPLATRLKHAVVLGAISFVPLAGVLMYNWAVSGSLTGRKEMSGQSLSDGLSQIVAVVRTWVVPPNAPDGFALLWLVVGLVGLAGAAVVLHPRHALRRWGPVLPFGGFAVAYSAFMVAIVPFTVHQGIDTRYLLPIYVPLLVVAALLLDRFLSSEAMARLVAVRAVLMSLVLLATLAHVSFSVHSNLHTTRQAWTVGYGYERTGLNSSYWEGSDILNYLRDNRMEGRIYSDNPYLAWFWSRTVAPGEHHFLPDEINHFTSAIMQWTDGDGGHVVWFRRWKPAYDYDELDIRILPGVEPVADLSDGAVFRVTATEPFDAERHRVRKQRYVDQLIEQAGEQVVRANWDVYHKGRTLTYVKKPCAPADTQAKFVLHVIPTDPADLPADRKQHGYDALGFYFNRYHMRRGFRLGDQCVVTTHLPAYPIGRIRVGQWIANEDRIVWAAEFSAGQ